MKNQWRIKGWYGDKITMVTKDESRSLSADDIAALWDENTELERTVKALANKVVELCGTCPVDILEWENPEDCSVVCNTEKDRESTCWIQWATANK